jgi:hypothetical protein
LLRIRTFGHDTCLGDASVPGRLQFVCLLVSATGVLELSDPVLCIILLYCLTVGRSDRLILELQIASSAIRGVDPCLDLGNPWGWNGIRGRDEKWNQLGTRSTHGDHGTERKPSPVSGAPGGRSTVLVPVPCMPLFSPAAIRPSWQRLFADDTAQVAAPAGRSQRDESCPASAAPVASWCVGAWHALQTR